MTMDTRTSYLGLRLEHLPAPRHSAITWTPSSVSKTRGARRLSSIPSSRNKSRVPATAVSPISTCVAANSPMCWRSPYPRDYPMGPDVYAEHIYLIKHAVSFERAQYIRTLHTWLA